LTKAPTPRQIEKWRKDYNNVGSHCAIGNKLPTDILHQKMSIG